MEMEEGNNIEVSQSEKWKGYDINDYEIRIPGCKDPADRHPVEEALYEKVGSVISKEMVGRGPELFDERGFPAPTLDTRLFDFIRVKDPGEKNLDRFLFVLYSHNRYHFTHNPRYNNIPSNWRPCSMSPFARDELFEGFREDLEEGRIPTPTYHQTSVRIGPGGGNFYNVYYPCVVEVTEQDDVEEIERLVQQAVELGLREDIINGTPESMKDLLARVANDDSLQTWDYREDFGLHTY